MSSHSPSSKQQGDRLLAGDSSKQAGGRGDYDGDHGLRAEPEKAADGKADTMRSTRAVAEILVGRKAKHVQDMSQVVGEEQFHDAPSPPVEEKAPEDDVEREEIQAGGEAEEEPPYPEPAVEEELLPPPDFRPFFTLVEDAESGEHHHPTMHYLFSDDDPEVLTSATLAAIEQQTMAGSQQEVEERFVLLDMAADGKTVTSASSMSPRWQAVKTSIGQAPSWGDGSQAADRGSMLKISGQQVREALRIQTKETRTDMDALVQTFNERLQGLDEIIGTEDAGSAAQEASLQKNSSNV